MNKKLIGLLTAIIFALGAGSAQAVIMLSFDPTHQSTIPGQQVMVDVRISGLGSSAAPSLGAYDIDVAFDDSILDFASLTFGDPVLGNQLDLFGFGSNPSGFAEDPNPAVGLVDFFEISLDTFSNLDTLQASDFVLATLTFNAVSAGTSPLNFSSTSSLVDSLGSTLVYTSSTGSVTVPEPTSLAVLGLGLGVFGYRQRKRIKAA